MGQFLYTLHPARPQMVTEGPAPEELAVLAQRGAYLARLTEAGVVHLAGRTQNRDPSAFGIVVFSAGSEAAARGIMNEDPGVKGGIMRARLDPYWIACWGEPGDRTARS